MTARLLARTNDRNTIEVHSLSGMAIVTMTDEFGQSAHLKMDLQTWVTFCHDSLARAREQYQALPTCDGTKCAPLVRNEDPELLERLRVAAKPPAS